MKDLLLAGVVGGVVGGVLVATLTRKGKVTRIATSDPRFSGVVIHNGVATISGQVGDLSKLEPLNKPRTDITAQTKQVLEKVDHLLAQAGTSKSQIIDARIWVKDIKRDFAAMNEVWNAWVDPQNKGARFCVESNLAAEALLVEVQVTAAMA